MAAPLADGPAFLRLVTHDLRAPVASVRTMVSLLSQGHLGQLEPPQAHLLGRIERRLESLQALLDDLIDLAALRACPGTGGSADLCAAARDACSGPGGTARPDGALRLDTPAEPVMVAAGSVDLELVLHHLLSNAFKYGRGRDVAVRVSREADAARLVVSDAGIGITPEAQAHLFEPLFRAAEAEHVAPGSGLGLVIVKEAVERCGGTLEIQSAVDVGTTVTVLLPLG